jgi:hypothetical protein
MHFILEEKICQLIRKIGRKTKYIGHEDLLVDEARELRMKHNTDMLIAML